MVASCSPNADTLNLIRSITRGNIWSWDGSAYTVISSLKPQSGFWINCDQAAQVSVYGQTSDGFVTLIPDWNLVGPTENCNRPEGFEAIYAWENSTYQTILVKPTC